MSITDACADLPLAYDPCAAVVSDFTASPTINTAVGTAPQHDGPNGIIHSMNWSVSDLWNCNLCANYAVEARNGFDSAEGSMTWSQLYTFSKSDDAKTLYSAT